MMRRFSLLLVLLLAGCGQMGPLYFPSHELNQAATHHSGTAGHHNTIATDGNNA